MNFKIWLLLVKGRRQNTKKYQKFLHLTPTLEHYLAAPFIIKENSMTFLSNFDIFTKSSCEYTIAKIQKLSGSGAEERQLSKNFFVIQDTQCTGKGVVTIGQLPQTSSLCLAVSFKISGGHLINLMATSSKLKKTWTIYCNN